MYAERDFVRQSLTLLVPRLSHRYIPSTHHSHRSYLPHIINLTVSTNPCYHRLAFSFLLLAFGQLRFFDFLRKVKLDVSRFSSADKYIIYTVRQKYAVHVRVFNFDMR